MNRRSSAYHELKLRLDEITALRKRAVKIQNELDARGAADSSAICRGAIVLLSSHLENYVKQLADVALTSLHTNSVPRSEISERTFYYFSQTFIREIYETKDPEKLSIKILDFLEKESMHWSRIGRVDIELPVEAFCKGFSNPNYDAVKKFLGRFGYSEFETELKKRLKAKFIFISNSIDSLVDLRNKIAHGDPSANRSPDDLDGLIRLVTQFAYATDILFCSWWRKKYCGLV